MLSSHPNLLSNRFILRIFFILCGFEDKECFGKHPPTLERVQNYHVVRACLQTIYAKDALVEARTIEERINYHKIEILTNHLTACHSLTNHCSSLLCVICFVTRASFVSVHLFSILQCPIKEK